MKKSMILLLFISLFLLTGCKVFNKTEPNENSVRLYLEESYQEAMTIDDVPDFTLEFDGTLNTILNIEKTFYTAFSANDDIILSDALTELFAQYSDSIYIEHVQTQPLEERFFSYLEDGVVANKKMSCDNDECYDEVAYISLENGLKLSVDYNRFVSDGVTYYTWRYSNAIAITLYYPLMRVSSSEICLLTLPSGVTFKVGPTLKLSSILKDEEYNSATYYTFEYFSDDDIVTLDDKKAYVTAYYQDYNEIGSEDEFTFDYLDKTFKVTLQESTFTISLI